ncbi:hypothetical protein [Cellulosilyticum sp. I15G10I2]|uniref:hypothetical protein n=1 Tax=Cellulosilyticum sp. I15G10I2 TaxID=1892843 RepID=UPI00085C72CE|nr:hypothetical protein [Cellulosilyticum sp. I15G10I2]
MGVLELLFEKSNPGPVGEINTNGKKPERPKIGVLITKVVISIAIIGFVFRITVLPELSIGSAIAFIILLVIYCVLGYFIMPKPDYSNMGWSGGLINNPFRFSDNINRSLFGLQIVLYPGRFIAVTFVQTVLLIKGEYK